VTIGVGAPVPTTADQRGKANVFLRRLYSLPACLSIVKRRRAAIPGGFPDTLKLYQDRLPQLLENQGFFVLTKDFRNGSISLAIVFVKRLSSHRHWKLLTVDAVDI